MNSFDEELSETQQWFDSPRFAGIVRLYTARQVIEQRGTIARDYTVARNAAEEFYVLLRQLFAAGKSITTFGPYSPGQAVAMKRMGSKGSTWAAGRPLPKAAPAKIPDLISPAIRSVKCPTKQQPLCARCSRRIATSSFSVRG